MRPRGSPCRGCPQGLGGGGGGICIFLLSKEGIAPGAQATSSPCSCKRHGSSVPTLEKGLCWESLNYQGRRVEVSGWGPSLACPKHPDFPPVEARSESPHQPHFVLPRKKALFPVIRFDGLSSGRTQNALARETQDNSSLGTGEAGLGELEGKFTSTDHQPQPPQTL